MSAIIGILYKSESLLDPKKLDRMNKVLNHRGPDGSGTWNDGPIGLGHQMLFTTPESIHEKLPKDEEGLVITAEARIDNRNELSKELGLEDLKEIPDSYFILKAYQKWCENCPEKLLGDFAFAIWDKNKKQLFCARDHMGIKPFYYYINDDVFLLSTEIRAILEVLEFKPKLNENKLAQTLVYQFEDKEDTIYKDIQRLPPAHKLLINENEFKIEEYWSLDPNMKLELKSDQDYRDKFLEIYTECVRCRLRSRYPVGFELSGGIDSSSVVSVADEINQKEEKNLELHSYTNYYIHPKTDETFFAKAVTKNKDIKSHIFAGDDINPLLDIENVIWHADMPYVPFSNNMMWTIYSKAKGEGIRVVMNGTFGDNVLAVPFPYLEELFRSFHWIRFIKELNMAKKRFKTGYKNTFLNIIVIPLIPEFIKKLLRKRTEKPFDEILFKEDFRTKSDISNKIKEYHEIEDEARKTLNTLHYRDLTYGVIQNIMEYDYHISSVFSIEMRYPYLDKRLIEFCYSLPAKMKVRNGWDKYIIRTSLEGILPKEIQWRSDKTNYANNFFENLFNLDKEKLGDILSANQEELKKYVDIEEIMEIYEEFKAGELYDKYKKGQFNSMMALWGVIILALWLKNYSET
jgi:asparagine synthase (glutamine-hydrolysing)